MGKTLVIGGADFSNVALDNSFSMNTDSMQKYNCSLGANKLWFRRDEGDRAEHVLYDVQGKTKVTMRITNAIAGSFYGFLSGNHSEPVVTDQETEYCSGCDRVRVDLSDGIISAPIPSDAKYIAFVTIDGANAASSWVFSVE